jgi:hypothetical protein
MVVVSWIRREEGRPSGSGGWGKMMHWLMLRSVMMGWKWMGEWDRMDAVGKRNVISWRCFEEIWMFQTLATCQSGIGIVPKEISNTLDKRKWDTFVKKSTEVLGRHLGALL